MISSIAGTTKTIEITEQLENKFLWGDTKTGMKSMKEVDAFNIHPNTIRSLPVGVCVRVGKYPVASSVVVAVDAQVESGSDLQCDAVADLTLRIESGLDPAFVPCMDKADTKGTQDFVSTDGRMSDQAMVTKNFEI